MPPRRRDDTLPIMKEPAPACRRCGACCRTFPVFASDADAEREPRIRAEALELKPWLRTERWTRQLFPLPFHERCCFLDAADRCTIHPTRPAVCREFEPGSDPCVEARRRDAASRAHEGRDEMGATKTHEGTRSSGVHEDTRRDSKSGS